MSAPQAGPAESRLLCNSPQWQAESRFLSDAYSTLRRSVGQRESTTTPSPNALEKAVGALPRPSSPSYLAGLGSEAALKHINDDIVPALNGQSLSSRYYGFVTGGALPVAEAADNIVSALDQNVAVHLPSDTVATAVEDAALGMVTSLLGLESEQWPGRILTTGATASNVLGLACGREAVISQRLIAAGVDPKEYSVGDFGLLQACIKAGVHEIQILTSMGHSSLYKAASIVGLGRKSVKALPLSESEPFRLDIAAVEKEAAREGVATIIAVSAGEVNTSGYATSSREDMVKLRAIADRYDAWIHVDGAFGIFARALPQTDEFSRLHEGVAGLELASSITADGHKLLNVPYDCGIFLTRSQTIQSEVFRNPNAAYLPPSKSRTIQNPLDIGIENSRRFRALPVYAVLISEGRQGMSEIFARMVRMARRVAGFLRASDDYELLLGQGETVGIIVLFRARDTGLNKTLVQRINKIREIYVSPTSWQGSPATRLAVSSWRVDVEKDGDVVENILKDVAKSYKLEHS
ncbi:hypothetical protein MCOR25_010609 [Pyricularia grisea]|uniref:Uncharacterized protein n=1 Tax=Pyricularia grisea TaxID=148305 RepID=A0A6P8B1L7_PYRGI|nr:uncharacterized protein PgNI_07667 [Pyricularia grisea]KAI6350073.1 hypothetical protein MCOR25_010609 [Pyricularia grisea]TLD08785.1 hypothetical protein PgNI_07667 [Pyricularia grisea]